MILPNGEQRRCLSTQISTPYNIVMNFCRTANTTTIIISSTSGNNNNKSDHYYHPPPSRLPDLVDESGVAGARDEPGPDSLDLVRPRLAPG